MKAGDTVIHATYGTCMFVKSIAENKSLIRLASGIEVEVASNELYAYLKS
jgi:hypothetical protein